MLSINMRVFKTVLLLCALFSSVLCLPLTGDSTEAASTDDPLPTTRPPGDFYDQRQNGTDNFRIHLDGLVFVIAPSESFFTVENPSQSLPSHNEILKPQEKPKPKADASKPIASPKSTEKTGFRLSQLLAPLLRRIRHE